MLDATLDKCVRNTNEMIRFKARKNILEQALLRMEFVLNKKNTFFNRAILNIDFSNIFVTRALK